MNPTSLRFSLSLVLLALILVGCSFGTHDVTREQHYSSLVGHRYRTKVDMYLFETTYARQPYLGLDDPKLAWGAKALPEEVSRDAIGKTFRGVTIIDVVPAGAELVTHAVIRDTSTQGIEVALICSLSYLGQTVSTVSLIFIQSNIIGSHGRLPEVDPSIVERIE